MEPARAASLETARLAPPVLSGPGLSFPFPAAMSHTDGQNETRVHPEYLTRREVMGKLV